MFYFYKGYQPLFNEMAKKLKIEFVPCLDFSKIKKLEDCLLVLDDSYETIYQEKEFVKLAVAGRHKKVRCVFVKHNFFHQSKWSRTIDLNTTHIILFKSPRELQQIYYLGRQLKNVEFLRDYYTRATSEPYGHLLIDLDPKTSECLRFCSSITAPGASIFNILSEIAKETNLTNDREKQAHTEASAEHKGQDYKSFICQCNDDAIKFICKCAVNTINGNGPCEVQTVIPFEKELRTLCNKATPNKRRRRTLASAKGVKLLKVISRPISSYFTP